jgi:hypothetical protein
MTHLNALDSKAASFTTYRPRLHDLDSPKTFEVIRGWINKCDKDHDCQSKTNYVPRRLLGVSESTIFPDVRIRDLAGNSAEKYAALSYCWGSGPDHVQVLTLKDNLEDHRARISFKTLPKSIQDAIRVTRELGIPYLWIDALCIVQDDDEELEDEMEVMGKTYENAYLTISASSARGCGEGFLNLKSPNPFMSVQYRHENGDPVPIKLSKLGGDIGDSSWLEALHTRGWTLQETLLSKRILLYSALQPYWRCQTTTWSAGRPNPFDYLESSGMFELMLPIPSKPFSELDRHEVDKFWANLVGCYSQRLLTNYDDKDRAIFAVKESISKAKGGHYLAGLWTESLHLDLTWIAAADKRKGEELWDISESCRVATAKHLRRQFPSWSWMSYDGEVFYAWQTLGQEDPGRREIEVLQLPKTDRFGRVVPGGILSISARAKKALIPRSRGANMTNGKQESASPRPKRVKLYDPAVWEFQHDTLCSEWNARKEEYELGTVDFDEFDGEAWKIEEDYEQPPLEVDCLHLFSRASSSTSEPTSNGVALTGGQEETTFHGWEAYGIVLGPFEGGETAVVRRGMFHGKVGSSQYFGSGTKATYHLR